MKNNINTDYVVSPLRVLSLFDGMSCGQIALNRAGIIYDKYYASEVDAPAIKVAMSNFENTIQLGDVCGVNGNDLLPIDILLGGSPCQGFSFSGKQLNFDDPRSKLFFEFVRILEECKPKYFLLENVVMKKEYEQVITDALGVEPLLLDSSLLSAQNRKRLYWTNIPNVTLPNDANISLVDILETLDMISPAAVRGRKLDEYGKVVNNDDKLPYTQCLEVRATNRNKSNCLTTVAKDNVLTSMPIGRYPIDANHTLPFRYYTMRENCRLQTVPEDYFGDLVSNRQITKMLGNGWTIEVISWILSHIPQV